MGRRIRSVKNEFGQSEYEIESHEEQETRESGEAAVAIVMVGGAILLGAFGLLWWLVNKMRGSDNVKRPLRESKVVVFGGSFLLLLFLALPLYIATTRGGDQRPAQAQASTPVQRSAVATVAAQAPVAPKTQAVDAVADVAMSSGPTTASAADSDETTTASPAAQGLAADAVPRMAPAEARASFDCSAARTKVEQTICSDSGLASLDAALGEAYRAALARVGDPKILKAAQRAWLITVRNACEDAACLARVYSERAEQLGTMPTAAS